MRHAARAAPRSGVWAVSVRILQGDCREALQGLPDRSVHCVVTSPPYFGLRSYLPDGHPDKSKEIGLEDAPDQFVAKLVEVFRAVRRVLRDDGTLWLNLGDSYAGSGRGGNPTRQSSTLQGSNSSQEASMIRRARSKGEIGATARDAAVTRRGSRLPAGLHEPARLEGQIGRAWVPPPQGLKQKDLIGIPWMLAFALRADGWFLRQDIIWSKPNPMPESVTDRCTKAHEYLFLLSKSPRYYYDAEAIEEPRSQNEDANGFRGGAYTGGQIDNATLGRRRTPGNKKHRGATAYQDGDSRHRTKVGLVAYSERERAADPTDLGTRNKRSVWTVATAPFKEAHFATFPPDLIEPCIKAGCPAGGTVLDPFGGAGTTGLVADRLQRNAILIELHPDYPEMAKRRMVKDAGMFAEIA